MLWLVGVLFALGASFAGAAGKQLLRYAELRRRQMVLKNDMFARQANVAWCTGMVSQVVMSPVMDVLSYAFAAQSILAPFGGFDIVWNTLLAPLTLHEQLTRHRLAGAAMIATGTTTSVFFGVQRETNYSRDELQDMFVSFRVGTFLVCMVAFWVGNIVFYSRLPVADLKRGLSLGITAGSLAGNMWAIKACLEMIKQAFREETFEVWEHWFPWTCLVAAIFFAVTNVKMVARGMQEFEVLFMATVFEGTMIIQGCVSSVAVMREFDDLDLAHIAGYITSVLLIVAGIVTLFCGEGSVKASDGRSTLPEEKVVKETPGVGGAAQGSEACVSV